MAHYCAADWLREKARERPELLWKVLARIEYGLVCNDRLAAVKKLTKLLTKECPRITLEEQTRLGMPQKWVAPRLKPRTLHKLHLWELGKRVGKEFPLDKNIEIALKQPAVLKPHKAPYPQFLIALELVNLVWMSLESAAPQGDPI